MSSRPAKWSPAGLNGHPPPYDEAAEAAALGAAIRHPDLAPGLLARVGTVDFFLYAHQKVYRAVADLIAAGKPVTLVTLRGLLRDRQQLEDVGGDAYLAELWDADPSGASAGCHADIVLEKARLRAFIHYGTVAIRDAVEGVSPAAEIYNRLTGALGAGMTTRTGSPPRFVMLRSSEFAGADYRPEWLVKGALVKGQPAVIAGPSKTLKTGQAIDLAVSLASGESFLGTFHVARPVRVAVVSGESGPHTLQETAARVCRAKGLKLATLGDRLTWCYDLPVFTNLPLMTEFAGALAGVKADVVIIDPLYLCLGDVDAKNLFEMGRALRGVADLLLKAGTTPVILHHFNRQLQVGEHPELSHIAYSGLEQFARQFLLLNRRERYQSDGRHDLWLRVGGSAGHGGLHALHVVEGVVGDDFGGRTWDVTVQTASEAKADLSSDREAKKKEEARRKVEREEVEVLEAIDAVVLAGQAAATRRDIRTRTGFGDPKVKLLTAGLVEAGFIEEVEFTKRGGNGSEQEATGFRRAPRGDGGNGGSDHRSGPPLPGRW